jgi:hypothetical protein
MQASHADLDRRGVTWRLPDQIAKVKPIVAALNLTME